MISLIDLCEASTRADVTNNGSPLIMKNCFGVFPPAREPAPAANNTAADRIKY
jgi:hypothetical protein